MVANVNRNDHARGWISFGPEHVVHFHEDDEKLVGVLLRNVKGELHSESAKPAAGRVPVPGTERTAGTAGGTRRRR